MECYHRNRENIIRNTIPGRVTCSPGFLLCYPPPHLRALRAFPSLNLGLPARALLPVSPGSGKLLQAKALPFCGSKHQGWDGPLGPSLLVSTHPPTQEIKASCPRGSAPSSEQIQHIQIQSPGAGASKGTCLRALQCPQSSAASGPQLT